MKKRKGLLIRSSDGIEKWHKAKELGMFREWVWFEGEGGSRNGVKPSKCL